MSLQERISDDLKDAMRTRDERKKSVLRMVRAAIKNAEVAHGLGVVLDDAGIIDVLTKQSRERRESIAEFTKGNRLDLAGQEASELEILLQYLPAQLSREAIVVEARAAVAEVGAKGPGDKAKVMPVIIGRLKGKADGRLINEVVTELLSAV